MKVLTILSCVILSAVPSLTTAQKNSGDPWQIKTDNIDPNNYYGITVANGMIGLVSSAEPLKVTDVILNGVYDNYQRGRVSNILKSFNHVNMSIAENGKPISSSNISNYTQELNMKEARLITRFKTENGLEVKHEILALRHLPYTSLVNVELTPSKETSVTIANLIEAPNHLLDIRNYYSEIDRPHVNIPLITSVAKSPSGKITVAASSSFKFQESHGKEPDIVHEELDYNLHHAKFNIRLNAGQVYRFSIASSSTSSVHFSDPHNEAERLTIYAHLQGEEQLNKRHNMAWNKLWESDILIEGDTKVQKEVRSALYHLYSFARKGTAFSMSPMGLSGLGYNGHVFWDTELWMYPPLLMLQPEIAKSLLEYRFERLEAAKQNALAHGYDGAMFPWESADDGAEDTPVWALTGPFEHHISGDIAWAFWKYYLVTKDKDWLRTRGYPVLSAVADFWTSRVERNGPGNYDINNVVGANEWEENIDNNAFTNGIAITSLKYAYECAQVLGIVPNPDWLHVANNIPILKFPDGTTRENKTYDGVMIKQADVNLLSFPLEIVSSKSQIEKDLKYYEPRMSPDGPAMGFCVLATIYAKLDNPDKAYDVFVKSYRPNAVPPFNVLAETAGGTNPYFATGAGGLLQTVISGFGGLYITDEGIVETGQNLPKKWKSLTIKIPNNTK